MRKILTIEFFQRPALRVAEDLLGTYLVKRKGKKEIALKITETEAYIGPKDQGSHAFRGITPRTKIMFGPAGVFYVYLIYGMYEMLNIVVDKDNYPAAILIRGVEGFDGPGKLTRYLKISRKLNRLPVSPESGLWVEDRGDRPLKKNIKRTPRIGINYAGDIWTNKLYRFVLKDD